MAEPLDIPLETDTPTEDDPLALEDFGPYASDVVAVTSTTIITHTFGFIFEPAPWMKFRNCADADPNLFFPGEHRPGRYWHLEAKAICEKCEVQQDCLDYALRHHQEFGVWGGMTRRERQAEQRRRRSGDA